MAKRSRKLSTRRPRRSKSSSRKTMKRTKRQPSKKRTLKKHSSKKRKSRTKSIRKRKKTKKVMKGGAGITVDEFIKYFNDSNANRTITAIKMTDIPYGIKTKMSQVIGRLPTSTREFIKEKPVAKLSTMSSGDDDQAQILMFLTDNKGKIIGVLISSYEDKIIVKGNKNEKLEKEAIAGFIKDNYNVGGFQVTDESFSNRAKQGTSLGKDAIETADGPKQGTSQPLYRPVYDASGALGAGASTAKAPRKKMVSLLPPGEYATVNELSNSVTSKGHPQSTFVSNESLYHNAEVAVTLVDYTVREVKIHHPERDDVSAAYLTLLDGENNHRGTTVEIVIDGATGNMSIPKFTDINPPAKLPLFQTIPHIIDYYKKNTFIYTKDTGQSGAVLLGNSDEQSTEL